MEKIRLGTIGSGKIVHSILNGVMETEGISLEAVYSRTNANAEELAAKYGCSKAYTDMDMFLEDKDINTIYIASPNSLHYYQAKKALLAGKNVICEKPFVPRAKEALDLYKISNEENLYLIEAVPTPYLPNYMVLKRELHKIGKIKLVMSNYSQYSSRYDQVLSGEKPNIFNPEYAGGCLMDINFYNIYLNIALFGMPERAEYYPNIYPGLSDTSGIMVMDYGDFLSQNAGAKDTWGINFFQIEGENGYIYVENGSNTLSSVKVVTKNSSEIFNEQPETDRWKYEIRKLTEIILGNNRAEIDKNAEITIKTVETMENARKKAGIVFPGDI